MTRLSLKSLAARPLRTVLTTLAIVLGVALVAGSLTLTDTQRKAADALSSASYDGTDAVVSAKTAFKVDSSEDWALDKPTIDASLIERVRSVPGVAVAVGDVTDMNAKIVGKDGKPLGDGPYFGVGYDAGTPGAERVSPFRLVTGEWAAGPGQVVIDQKTSEDEGYGVGDRIEVTGVGEVQSYTVTGVARFGDVKSLGPATAAIFSLETARKAFGKGDGVDSILVAGRDGVSAESLRATLARELGSAAQVEKASEHDRFTFDGLEMFISIIRMVLLGFGGVAVLVGGLTIINSLTITLAQRTKEIGLLRLVGAGKRQVMVAVLLEALVIGLLGSLAGVGVGYLLAKGLQSLFTSMGLDLPDAGTVFSTQTIVISMLVGTVITVISGLIPAYRATRVAPVQALRDAAGAGAKVGIVGRIVSPVVSLLGRPAQRLAGVAGLLARRNALRNPGRTMATAGALTVGVALVTVVAIMAAGLKDTTSGQLERQLDATHLVTGQDGWSPTDASVSERLRATDGVSGVTTIRQDTMHAFGDNERVNAIDGSQVSFKFADGSARADQLGRDGAIIDEGWATEHGIAVGERFSIQSPTGEELSLVARAIERSPVLGGLDFGPVTISAATYDGAFRNEKSVLTVVDAGGVSTDSLSKALAAFPDAKVQDKAAFIDSRTADIDMLMGIFVVLLALAVIVSLFGIVNALVLATFERRRELGMLAAVGMTRRQVRRMIRQESIMTSLLGAVTGVIAGFGLGALVTSLLADEGLTFVVPAGSLVGIAVVAVIAGVLAAIVPARRAARLSPLTALAYE
jgi:putative ABC transport system permease protein